MPGPPTQPPRGSSLREQYLEVFRRIGQRRRRALFEADAELGRAAILISRARAAGTPVDPIAEALGVSKPVVYDLVKARGSEEHAQLLLLSTLAARGGLTADQLAAELQFDVRDVEAELRSLKARQLVAPLMTHYGAGERNETYWTLTPEGEGEMFRLVEHLGEPEQRRFSVYFELSDEERESLPGLAADRLGPVRFALLEPAMTRLSGTIRRPELAFTVTAAGFQEAESRGRAIFTELQQSAGLKARAPLLAFIADATGSL
jgi:DNA-binding MarR family transcriptional regulator